MAKVCDRCGGPLDLLKPGRVPKYCSLRCRVAAHRARKPQIPAVMRERDRWVSWKPVRRQGKLTKMPVQVSGRSASSTNAATWTSWSQVSKLERRGFVLGGGIGCVDLDHCLVNGRPSLAAARFLAKVPETYIEVSPSGDGLHVWGLLPEGPGSKRTIGGLSIETYSVGRYITVTGKTFDGSVSRLGDLTTLG